MLTYLIIAIIVAIALAPLVQLRPSKQQRKIAAMREYAAVHGLFVEFRNAPSSHGAVTPVGEVVYYGKRLPNERRSPVMPASWVHYQDGWRSVGTRVAVPAPVMDLSPEILAASVDPTSCGVYWKETSDTDAVEQIRVILERWCAELIR